MKITDTLIKVCNLKIGDKFVSRITSKSDCYNQFIGFTRKGRAKFSVINSLTGKCIFTDTYPKTHSNFCVKKVEV
jgi:hypothetical protein